MSTIDQLMDTLDTHKPDWWIEYATQQELIECVRRCTDGRSGTVEGKLALRKSVLSRLMPAINAGFTEALR